MFIYSIFFFPASTFWHHNELLEWAFLQMNKTPTCLWIPDSVDLFSS